MRVSAPAKDVRLAQAQPVEVQIETADDLALRSVALRFTRLSGSGESFTFQEGEVPLFVTRLDGRRWTAAARWALGGLKLEDGDALVYRAVARDSNPAAEWVSSESFTDRDRPGLRAGVRRLRDSRGRPPLRDQPADGDRQDRAAAERAASARASRATPIRRGLLGVEQRMVQAEFIFLSGGEVEDEVEEAEQSHELVEGRLENVGRAEMLRAIAEMSRAEARLNLRRCRRRARPERAALQALQRAFDRRRYFLRVTPERARIDPPRRLSGSLADARSWPREPAHASVTSRSTCANAG